MSFAKPKPKYTEIDEHSVAVNLANFRLKEVCSLTFGSVDVTVICTGLSTFNLVVKTSKPARVSKTKFVVEEKT